MSLRRIVVNAFAMSTVTMLRMLAQVFVVPVMARFLSPADYGVVAMAMPFVLFAMMLSDAGVGMSLVRTPREKHEEWSTCFWLASSLGLGLTTIIAALGPVASVLLAEPRLGPIVMALSLVVVLQSLATVPGIALQQNQRFRTIAVIEVVSMAASIASAVLSAMHGAGAWALVIQQLVQYVVKLILTFPSSGYRPGLTFRLGDIKDHLVFGRDVLGINFIYFLSQSLDSTVIGRVLGASSTGIYSMATLFANLPQRLVTGPLQLVTYPHFSQIRHDMESLRTLFLFFTRALASAIIPGMTMIAISHEPVFRLLLSEKWMEAGHIFMLIAPSAALATVTGLYATVLLAAGRTDIRMRQAIEGVSLRVVALAISVPFGVEWVATAYMLVSFAYLPRSLMLGLPAIGCPVSRYLMTFLVPLTAAMICAGIYVGTQDLIHPGDWAQLALAAGLAVCGIAGAALVQFRQLKEGLAAFGASSPRHGPEQASPEGESMPEMV